MIYRMKKLIYIFLFITAFFQPDYSQAQIINSYAYTSVSSDADANAFISAAGITDATVKNAVINLVLGLKDETRPVGETWSKYKAIYPFASDGISQTREFQHKFNLINPLDTDAAFRLTFNGTITHDSNGITGDGSTGYANTHLIPSTDLTYTGNTLGLYNRTSDSGNTARDFGAKNGTSQYSFHIRYTNGIFYYDGYGSGLSGRISFSNPSTAGYYQIVQVGDLNKVFINNILKGSKTINQSALFLDLNNSLFIGALNENGIASTLKTNRNYAFSCISNQLTDLEAAADYTVIQAFQEALNREVI